MPLQPGSSRKAITANIRELIGSGYRRTQAIAIALHKAGRSRAKGKPAEGRRKG